MRPPTSMGSSSPRSASVLAALAALTSAIAAAKPPEPAVESPEITLESLESEGAFEVRLEGDSAESFLSKKRCLYFEWTYGVREGGNWQTRWSGFHSETPVVVVTPKGKLTLRTAQLRTYLAPALEKTWTKKDLAQAPEVVKEKLAEEPVITAMEHCLQAGKTYYARVHVDTYRLPPESHQSKPSKRRNPVLWLSDQPFGEDGKPKPPLTPAYQGWSY